MKKGPLDHYRGRLLPAEIAAGINAAWANAHRLAVDARYLLSLKRYPSAAALAILAIEEAGKVPILRALPFARGDDGVKEVWRDYRDHRAKNGVWLVFDLLQKTGGRFDDVASAANKNGEHTALLDAIKKLSIYTECLGQREWSTPTEVATPELAAELVRVAETLARPKAVTAREIELWIEYVAPVWNSDKMAAALVDWAMAMKQEGLPAPTALDLQKFLSGQGTLSDLIGARRDAPPSEPQSPPSSAA